MISGHHFSRRGFSRLWVGWMLARPWLRAAEESADGTSQLQPAVQRRYRADAQIILLSIAVVRRKGVGDGSAVWRDSLQQDGSSERFLEFTGRSDPERAAGLNRFGFIQEISRAKAAQNLGSRYFGLMTSSPEENAADARKALQQHSGEVPFSASEGSAEAGHVESANARFLAPARTSASDRNALIELARAALMKAPKQTMETAGGGAIRPFLHVLADVLATPGTRDLRYFYNNRVYRMRTDRAPDPKARDAFRSIGLIGATAAVTRISGALHREDGGKASEFKLWIEDGCPRPLPLRIEYQPKTYLRLTFEAEA